MGDILKNMLTTVVSSSEWPTPPILSPWADIVCVIVNLIKGGFIEDIPGIGDMIKYLREFVFIALIVLFIFLKVMQYIGPKLWDYLESKKRYLIHNHPKPLPPGGVPEEEEDPREAWEYIPNVYIYQEGKKFFSGASEAVESASDGWSYFLQWLDWAPRAVVCWCITTFLQIPIDILSWDMESLSIDFGNDWYSKGNFFRGGCERFINGSYAGDYSKFKGELIDTYLLESENINAIMPPPPPTRGRAPPRRRRRPRRGR